MAVLAVPINQPFEVDKQKSEAFIQHTKTQDGKAFLQERMKNLNRDFVRWETKK